MKQFFFLCVVALSCVFAACEPDEDTPNDANELTVSQVVGTWQSNHVQINAEDAPIEISITMNEDGTGYINDPSEAFHYTLSGMNVLVTPQNGNVTLTFTIESITETEMVLSGSTIPGTDQVVSFKGWFTKVNGNVPDDNPGNLGISAPQVVQITAHTMTITSHLTGDVENYLSQYPEHTCGYIWCPQSEGLPTMNSNVVTAEGDNLTVTIGNLEELSGYHVCAWLKLTPNSTPIISDYRIFLTEQDNTPEWVDLGLPSGLLWANHNLGANTPYEHGFYYAWGETSPKSDYSSGTYIYTHGDSQDVTKYCRREEDGWNGYTDNRSVLEPGDDAATVNLGNGARTPTVEEWEELMDNTTAEWQVISTDGQNVIYGITLTASNGNSIFLPVTGEKVGTTIMENHEGSYWSSTLAQYNTSYHAEMFNFWSSNGAQVGISARPRPTGLAIRAVHAGQ